MRYVVTLAEEELVLDVEPHPEGGYVVRGPEGREARVAALSGGSGLVELLIDGQVVSVLPAAGEVRVRGERFTVHAENWQTRGPLRAKGEDQAHARAIAASMPGRIVRVLCEVGAQVEANAPVIVIEAMKMQNELCAKRTATVRAVHVSVGQTVERGALLVEFD